MEQENKLQNDKQSVYGKLMETAIRMLPKAYAPYSHFHVAAALLCSDGSIVTGVNVENASYPAGICAERTAICKAVSEGKRSFQAIAIAGCPESWLSTADYQELRLPDHCPPCGICRQVMREFSDPDSFEILLPKSPEAYQAYRLSELLPESFGPENLS